MSESGTSLGDSIRSEAALASRAGQMQRLEQIADEVDDLSSIAQVNSMNMADWMAMSELVERQKETADEDLRYQRKLEEKLSEAWDEGQKSGMRYTDRMRAAYEIGRPELPGPPSTNPYK